MRKGYTKKEWKDYKRPRMGQTAKYKRKIMYEGLYASWMYLLAWES